MQEADPFVVEMRPSGQSMHWSIDASPETAENFPIPQRPKQAASLVIPVCDEYLPAEQRPKHSASETSPEAAENLPAEQRPKHSASEARPV